MRTRFVIIFITAFLAFLSISKAQEATVNVYTDSAHFYIGDQIKVHLLFKSTQKTNVIIPQIPDTIGALEVILKSKVDTIIKDGVYELSSYFIACVFDTGKFTIPAFTFLYEKSGFNTLFPLSSNALDIIVNSVRIDTTSTIKDIKPIIDLSKNLLWFYFLLAIVILAIIALFIYKKVKKHKTAKPEKLKQNDIEPKIPPFILAINKLKYIESQKLWLSDKKVFYSSVTDTIRIFIEASFHIKALEIPSTMLVAEMKSTIISHTTLIKTKQLLDAADLVKFAKYIPIDEESCKFLTSAFEVLNLLNNDKEGSRI